jgi:hypothetical protein
LRSPNVWVGPRPVAVAGCPIWKSKPDWTGPLNTIRAPYVNPEPTSTGPFSTCLDAPTLEDETVQDAVGNLFTSLVISSGHTAARRTMFLALVHEDDHSSVVLVFTSRGRILEIP